MNDTANPQFLKLKGAQQPSNSYISMVTLRCILHTLTEPATNDVAWNLEHLQCFQLRGPVKFFVLLAGSDAYIV